MNSINCGSPLNGQNQCVSCGGLNNAVSTQQQPQQVEQQQPAMSQQPMQQQAQPQTEQQMMGHPMPQQPGGQQSFGQNPYANPTDSNKGACILAYIGFLWIISIILNSDNNETVRFHIGQGIIVTIVTVILNVIVTIVNTAIITSMFTTQQTILGIPTVSGTGLMIMTVLNLAAWGISIAFMIIGLMNVSKGVKKELPIIGKWAFYR